MAARHGYGVIGVKRDRSGGNERNWVTNLQSKRM